MILLMKSPEFSAPEVECPEWLPGWMRRHWSGTRQTCKSVAGPYFPSELWMLENHVRDMQRGRSVFVIAPMENGIGTYRVPGTEK